MRANTTPISGRVFALLFAFFVTIAGVIFVQSVSSAPYARAQNSELMLGTTTTTTKSLSGSQGRVFTATASESGTITQLTIDLPTSPTVKIVSPMSYNQVLIDGKIVARESSPVSPEIPFTQSRDSTTGKITINLSKPIDVVAGQSISVVLGFATTINVTGAKLHAWSPPPKNTVVRITETFDKPTYISGPLKAQVYSQNGFDVDGSLNSTFTVVNELGEIVHSFSGRPGQNGVKAISSADGKGNGWGGVEFTVPKFQDTFLMQPGWKLVFDIPFAYRGTTPTVDSTVKGPIGPNKVTYYSKETLPTTCSAQSPLVRTENGTVINDPFPRLNHTSTSRMKPRELTPEERRVGTSVYVTASSPSGQDRMSTQLYRQVSMSDEFVPVGKETGWVINSLAYNHKDNYLYGISQGRDGIDENSNLYTSPNGSVLFHEDPCYPAGHLLQIHPVTGEVVDLGKIGPAAGTTAYNTDGYGFNGEYGMNWPNDLWGGINVGFFDGEGNLWMSNSSLSGSGAMYKIDIDAVTAWTNFRFTSEGRSSSNYGQDAWRAFSEDYAVLPSAPDYAWGIVNSWASDGKVYLERIDLRDGKAERFDITDLKTATGEKIAAGHQWSKAWVYSDGTLGFGTGSTGQNSDVARIAVENPGSDSPTFAVPTIFDNAPAAYNTNGTSNGYSSPIVADLVVKKRIVKIDPVTRRTSWAIDVWNNGPDGISRFQLVDVVPKEYQNVTFDGVTRTGVDVAYQQKLNGNTVEIDFGALPARPKNQKEPQITVTLSAELPEDATAQCFPNSVRGDNTEYDPTVNDPNAPGFDNNYSWADCFGTADITKVVKDTNDDKTVNSDDVKGPDQNGMYKVTYDVTVKNDSTFPAKYGTVYDTPKFPNPAMPIQQVWVTKPGATAPVELKQSADKPGSYVLDNPGELKAGESRTYTVEVYFLKSIDLKTNPDLGICTAGGNGLFNTAEVDGKTADACVDIPVPKDMKVQVVKIDAEHRTTKLDGAEFKTYLANSDGTKGNEVATVKSNDDLVTLKPNTSYILEETKAPRVTINGETIQYQLLAQPVQFHTEWNADGSAKIVIDKGGSGLVIPGAASTDNTVGLIQVADIRQGTLPRTGGEGVQPYLLLSMFMFGTALLFGRRKQLK